MARDYQYSRLNWAEERRLKKRTILLGVLTFLIIVGFVFWGLPGIPRVISLISWGNSAPAASNSDKTPPPPPILLTSVAATSSAQFVISGRAEPNSLVEVKLNGSEQASVTASSDGAFRSGKLTLVQGNNEIQAIAVDLSGNRSQPSKSLRVLFDNSKPDITVYQPSDGQKFVGSKQQLITISGRLAKQATLSMNQRFLVVSGDGSFSSQLSLNSGENTLILIASDSAGNTAFKQLSVSFEP